MANLEIFESAVRTAGDLAGVFEYDGETGYFYLYETFGQKEAKVLAALHVLSALPDFNQEDVIVRWNVNGRFVGLFIRGCLWGAFDADNRSKFGGNYRTNTRPSIPADVASAFHLQ